MRLLKLMAYALFGYALYEFVRGMMEQESARPAMSGASGSRQGATPRQNITGPGEGADVETADTNGGAMHHRVGRGVVRK
jgi:hypothetical protein